MSNTSFCKDAKKKWSQLQTWTLTLIVPKILSLKTRIKRENQININHLSAYDKRLLSKPTTAFFLFKPMQAGWQRS